MQGFDLRRAVAARGYAQPMGLLMKAVIAAVNGYAVGAASPGPALRPDHRRGHCPMAFIKVGAVPDCGALYFLPRLVGLPKAKELVFTGANIDAAEAYRIGIVNRVVPAAELLPEALRLGQQLADGPAVALALAKEILNASSSLSLEQVMELEIYAQSLCFQTEDHKEGVIAFLEKRKPVFKGR